MKVVPIKTRLYKKGENLFSFIIKHVPKLSPDSILAVTSKIVALGQGRTNSSVSEIDFDKLVKKESTWALKTKYTWLTIKDGFVAANAGIDKSNGNGQLILLPSDSFKLATELRKKLCQHYKIKKLGIIITDSRILPLRAGVVGMAVGYAGFKGVKDYRGQPDIFGRKFKISRVDIADSLACTATLMMGEGNERQPLAIITNAPVKFTNTTNRRELSIKLADDMYYPLFKKLKK